MGVYDKHHLTMIDERKYYILTLEKDLFIGDRVVFAFK